MPTHDTGVWLTDDGEVVYEQPKGGSTVLVAKGGEVSNAVRTRLASYGRDDVNLPQEETSQEDAPVETATAPDDTEKAVSTDAVKSARKTRTSARKK